MVFNGESYKAVSRFCYLGDMLDAGGGCDDAVTYLMLLVGRKALKEVAPILISRALTLEMKGEACNSCVKSNMIHSSES